jgi:hypothetical protein
MMHPISLKRFDALAAYCRFGPASWLVEECAWYESEDGQLLGLVLLDPQDGDYQAAFLARDHAERFRWIHGTAFFDDINEAIAELRAQAPTLLARIEAQRAQGEGPPNAVDFFALRVPVERLHPNFSILYESEGYSPARELLKSMMRWHEDVDGNFVEQFQSAAFDARLLEIYVFALLVENHFSIEHVGAAPDYLATSVYGEIAIEVTTANPTLDDQGKAVHVSETTTREEQEAYLKQYVPMKFGSALTSKLRRRYWELEHVANKPLLFAIQDFHAPQSMTFARTGLGIYLYGYDYDWHRDHIGQLVIVPRRVTEHRWGAKVIPSGFFDLEGAENVSAVLFNSSATLAKFNRMGFVAGFGSRRVQMLRKGTALNPDPDAAEPLIFTHTVDEDYRETWSEGLDIFHNPRAQRPLDPRHFPFAAHHFLEADGQMRADRSTDVFHPLASITQIIVLPRGEQRS